MSSSSHEPTKGFWGIVNRSFWLGDETSSINTNRFWLYLVTIGLTLCLVCLIRAVRVG